MLAVNRAKYAQHADLQSDLLSTGEQEIAGMASTLWKVGNKQHGWSRWNGRIQMLIREELRAECDRKPGVMEGLQSEFSEYEREHSLLSGPESGAFAKELESLSLFGLEM